MKANSICMSCILNKQTKMIDSFEGEERKSSYLHEVLGLLYQYGQTEPAPWFSGKIDKLYHKYFGDTKDYSEIRHQFNQFLLSKESILEERVREMDDPVRACIQYVCAGNYIDFSVVPDVNEKTLMELLDKAADETVQEEEYLCLKEDLSQARELVYLTDNCGEVVLDKLFLKMIRETYPALHITVFLRGVDTVNDATMDDAREIGLDQICDCKGNGSRLAVPGTALREVSEEFKNAMNRADVIISKGQGNFEGLYGTGYRPYYLFLCKCELFMRRFQLPQFTSVFIREDHIKDHLN